MIHTFIIAPGTYTAFEDEAEQIAKCKEWGLLSDKAIKSKSYMYKGNGLNLACAIAGYADSFTAVIRFEDGKLHCIHPSFLKEMQASSYGQKSSAAASEQGDTAAADGEQSSSATEEAQVSPAEPAAVAEAAPAIEDISEPPAEPKPKAKEKVKSAGKAPKLELPEDKVKMTATVKEFTTVPNNFSDTEDEVIIYEAAAIIDPTLEVGAAWSSHSATLKKLELEIGDTLAFECKIVAKKLTKHPVPYKINNPSKIQKVQA